MRARNLKPEFFTDRKIAGLGAKSALIYQALWVLADDGGVCRCDPDYIKAQLFYLWDDVTAYEIAVALHEYYRSARVVLYRISDELYAEIASFEKHQKPNHPSKFRYPRGGEQLTENATVALRESYRSTTPPVPVTSTSPSKDLKHSLRAKTPREVPSIDTTWLTPYHDLWTARVGIVTAKRCASAIAPVRERYGDEATLRGLTAYLDEPRGPDKPVRLEYFKSDAARWIREGATPLVQDGVITARGERVSRSA